MQENLHEKGGNKRKNSLQQSEKFSDDIVRVLNDYFTAGSRFENGFDELSIMIPQLKDVYKEEKKRLSTYQELSAEGCISPEHVLYHANEVQDKLDKLKNMVDNLRDKLRSIVIFFDDKDDKILYHTRIDDFYVSFQDIFYKVWEIIDEEKDLVEEAGQ